MSRYQAVTIDADIPIPRAGSRWRMGGLPLAQMKVGNSFLVPLDMPRNTLGGILSKYGKETKTKFITRMTEDRQIRCWRTK